MSFEWHAVIMAGGMGERLHPLTGPRRLKPLLPVRGGGTLLTRTLRHAHTAVPSARTWVVTTARCYRQIRQALPSTCWPRVIVEPQVRGTATCIALMAHLIAARDADAGMIVMPSDHWITPASALRSTLRVAMRRSERATAALTCIGIRPTEPHPGYGYMHHAGARVTRFIEKPSRAQAAAWLRRGSVAWNSGIFIGAARAFQAAIRAWLPRLAQRVSRLPQQPGRALERAIARLYPNLSVRSFDRSVLERHDDVRLVRAQCAWHDVGSWASWPVLLRMLDADRL